MDKHNHTFVICAYKESAYLEECILSLINQSVKSNIIMITSTPNEYISNLANKYDIKLHINNGESGIVQDWNFGYNLANTRYITIAHQDDVYSEQYAKKVLARLVNSKKPLIAFTDYGELRNGEFIDKNKMLSIKRLMMWPLECKIFCNSIWIRRRILSMGNPICCPSVTFCKDNMPDVVFNVKYRACEDWEAWEKLSKLKGEFCYVTDILMHHRIHEESETSIIIGDNVRSVEDYDMYCKFWPKFIANILIRFYSKAQNSNDLEGDK